MKRTLIVSVCVLLASFVTASLVSCKKTVKVSHTAYIIGNENNIISMSPAVESRLPEKAVKASVLITTNLKSGKLKFCSGTLIEGAGANSNPRVLTNHHCFAETDEDNQSINKLLSEACNKTKVYFNFAPKSDKPAISFSCVVGSMRTNFTGDLAVFTLAGKPPEEYQPLTLWTEENDPKDRKAFIVHYPDVQENRASPEGVDFQLPTQAATIDDCTVLGPFAENEWHLDPTLPYALKHTCDLIHGSSGSALIDADTVTILGVNWGGIKITYSEGVSTDNVATKASFVRAFLDNVEGNYVPNGSGDAVPNTEVSVVTEQSDSHPPTLKEKLKARFCGVVGGNTAAPVALLLLALFLPFVVRKYFRK